MFRVIGCDPGSKGAICSLSIDGKSKPVIEFIDLKHTPNQIKAFLTNPEIALYTNMAMIEDVHSLPGTSAKSNFSFGRNLGMADTLLCTQDWGLDKVQPKVWQKFLGVTIPKGITGKARATMIKKTVAKLCERLYPGCAIYGPMGGLLDGRSDALAIAHYCAHKYMSANYKGIDNE